MKQLIMGNQNQKMGLTHTIIIPANLLSKIMHIALRFDSKAGLQLFGLDFQKLRRTKDRLPQLSALLQESRSTVINLQD